MSTLLFLAALYCLPAIIAACRGHHQTMAIVMLDVLAGWTAVGWVIAMVWACTRVLPNNGSYITRVRAPWSKP